MSSFHYMTEDKWSRLIVTENNPVMKPNHPSKSTQDYSCGCFKSYQNIPKEKKKKSLVKLPVLKNHGIRMWAVNKNQCFLEQHETLPPRFSFLQALCMCPWRCACQGEIYSNAVQMGRWQWKKGCVEGETLRVPKMPIAGSCLQDFSTFKRSLRYWSFFLSMKGTNNSPEVHRSWWMLWKAFHNSTDKVACLFLPLEEKIIRLHCWKKQKSKQTLSNSFKVK